MDLRRVAPQGPSSVRRGSNLVEYTKSMSWLRVFIVCSLALSPAFVFVTLIELLPLRPPSEGWKANWGYWLRASMSITVISFGGAIQFALIIPASGLKLKNAFGIAIGATIGFIVFMLVLAMTWCFPIPFGFLFGSPTWLAIMCLSIFLSIGTKKWRENPEIAQQMKAAARFLLVESFLMLIYPLYNVCFLRLSGLTQVAFVLLLPVIKYFVNLLTRQVSTDMPAARAIGTIAVKLFDALYMLKCMGSAGSLVSGAVLITIDLLQNMYHFRQLHRRVRTIRQSLTEKDNLQSDRRNTIEDSIGRTAFRSYSILHLRSFEPSVELGRKTVALCPIDNSPSSASLPASQLKALDESAASVELDHEVRELLQESERLVLLEFIECAVPMFYAMYLFILYRLPNAKYYPEMANSGGVKMARAVRSIAAYAALEFGSLLSVHGYLRWKLNISGFHMLANVLERDNAVIQAVCLTWVVVVAQWTLQHGGKLVNWDACDTESDHKCAVGVDYSFKFHWS